MPSPQVFEQLIKSKEVLVLPIAASREQASPRFMIEPLLGGR